MALVRCIVNVNVKVNKSNAILDIMGCLINLTRQLFSYKGEWMNA